MRLALLIPAVVAALAAADTNYSVVKTIRPGGDGGWDYLTVDTAAHRLYVTRGTHVQVIDTDRDSLVGDLAGTAGVHGVTLDLARSRGYTSNGRDSSVTVFDTKTLGVLARVHIPGRNPDAIYLDDATKRVMVYNGGSASVTAIDSRADSVVGTLALGGKPEFSTSDGQGTVFVNIEDTHEVVAFDARTMTVKSRWLLAGCEDPTGQAIDRAQHRLFVVCGNKVMTILDSRTGRQVATAPIGEGCDGVAYDVARHTAFASNGEGTITVVVQDGDRYRVTQTVKTMARARTVTVDQRTHRVYTVSAEFGATPAATAEAPRPRAPMVPGSFTVITLAEGAR